MSRRLQREGWWRVTLAVVLGATVLPFVLIACLAARGTQDYGLLHPAVGTVIPAHTRSAVWAVQHAGQPLLSILLLAAWALAWWGVMSRVPGLERRRDAGVATLGALALWLTQWPAIGDGLFQAAYAYDVRQLGALALLGSLALLLAKPPRATWLEWPLTILAAALAAGAAVSGPGVGVLALGGLVVGTLIGLALGTATYRRWLVTLAVVIIAMGLADNWQSATSSAGPTPTLLAGRAALAFGLLALQWAGKLSLWLAVLVLLPLGIVWRRRFAVLGKLSAGQLGAGVMVTVLLGMLATLQGMLAYGPRLPRSALNGLSLIALLAVALAALLGVARAERPWRWVWSRRLHRGLLLLFALSLLLVGPQSGAVAWQRLRTTIPAYRQALDERVTNLLVEKERLSRSSRSLSPLPPEPWLSEGDLGPDPTALENRAWAAAFAYEALQLASPAPPPVSPAPALPPTTLSPIP